MSALDWLVSFTLRPLHLMKITLVTHFTKYPTPSLDTVAYKNCLPLEGSNPGRSASSQLLLWPIHSGCSTIKSRKLHRELVCKMRGRCLVATDVFPYSAQPRSWRGTFRRLSVTAYSHITAIPATDVPCPDGRGPI